MLAPLAAFSWAAPAVRRQELWREPAVASVVDLGCGLGDGSRM